MSSLEKSGEAFDLTYKTVKDLHYDIDSYNVVKEVERYRDYWKPSVVNVILLAESHVYTSDGDFQIEMNYYGFDRLSLHYPRKFVRFVYCIGYSEPKLFANKPINPNFKNPGTWQFWKIFCACASENEEINCDNILKGTAKSFITRINNKIDLLEKLRAKGIWLVDSSIAGINNLSSHQKERVILTSWKGYVRSLVEEASPRTIVCIGKTVHDTLKRQIKEMDIPCEWIHQPQARLTYEQREDEHKKLQHICQNCCSKSLSNHKEPASWVSGHQAASNAKRNIL